MNASLISSIRLLRLTLAISSASSLPKLSLKPVLDILRSTFQISSLRHHSFVQPLRIHQTIQEHQSLVKGGKQEQQYQLSNDNETKLSTPQNTILARPTPLPPPSPSHQRSISLAHCSIPYILALR